MRKSSSPFRTVSSRWTAVRSPSLNARRASISSPSTRTGSFTSTIAAFLSILFSAINGQPPETTLAIPEDFVRTIMDSLGLGTREVGLNAMLMRIKRHAQEAARAA
jgi:hypothetical protein